MRKKRNLPGAAVLPALILAVVLVFFSALSDLESGRTEEGRLRLEEAVRRSAVACFAAEGIYPPTLDYLEAHYGLQVDEERYVVIYEALGSNLMPDITVLDNET